jgi:hypothetical protein
MNDNELIGDVITGLVNNDGTLDSRITVSSGSFPSIIATTPWDSINDNITDTFAANKITVPKFYIEEFLEERALNRIAVDHKVTDAELMKLKEVAPDYANEIKDNIARNLARELTAKIAYKKKHDKDADVHHFIGRCWVFSDEEIKRLIEDARNV